MKRFLPYLLLLPLIFASCLSTPSSSEEMQANASAESTGINRVIDPEELQNITAEQDTPTHTLSIHEMYYDPVAEADIMQVLENLSIAIRTRNYPSWRAVMDDEYFQQETSAENLAELSNMPYLKTQNIILRNEQDYFIEVVVKPLSRWASSSINDNEIEFLSADNVRVYGQTVRGSRGQVYELTRINNQWKVTK